MASTQDIGTPLDKSSDDLVPVFVQAGGSGTNIAVNSGDTLYVLDHVDNNGSPVATLTAGQNQTFTVPVWVQSNSISNVTFSGPGY